MIDDSYSHDPEPPICRHRAGDPECMCQDDEPPKPRIDQQKAMASCIARVDEIVRNMRSDL